MQAVPITTKVLNLNLADGEVYAIQHYVIEFVSDLRQVSVFFGVFRKTDRHDIAEILLKVAFSTITLTLTLKIIDTWCAMLKVNI